MSDNQLDLDDLFHEPEEGEENEPDESKQKNVPKALREHAKQLKKENDELKSRLDNLETSARTQALDKFVETKGLDPVVKELIGDKDPEEWFQKYGHAFAAKTNEGDEGGDEGEDNSSGGPKQQLTEEQKRQLQDVTSVQAGRSGGSTGGPNLSKLDSASTEEEAMQMLAEQGLLAPNNSQT